MYKRVKWNKFLIVLVLITFISGNSLPVMAQTVGKVSTSKVNLPKVKNGVVQLEAEGQADAPPAVENPGKINTIEKSSSKQVSYGPYNEDDSKKGHAYEPFKEKTEKKDVSKELGYRKDRVLVKYKSTVTKAKSGTYSVKGKSLSLSKQGIKELEPLVPEKKASSSNAKVKRIEAKLANWNKAFIAKGKDIEKVVKDLKNDTNVESVEYDYIRAIDETTSTVPLNDENINEQWHLESSGVNKAWEYLKSQGINPGGSRDVVVAVIDTGVDYNHPDLKGNMWVNTGEIPGNRVDDDQNGFVDDIYGASTVGNPYAGESGDPADDNGHGTHVAGIIAAQGNNSIGGVGVAYNTRIMAIKAAQSSGVLSSSDIAEAIRYAVDKGADVINMSFGGYGRSTVEEDALQIAFGTSVLVAAAGNDGKPNLPHPLGADMYPAAYNWVLGVMAEKPSPSANGDYLADFSNWDFKQQDSHEYEVMAPGVDIYSTLPNGQYAKWSGTSMATPVVAGIAALARSKFADKDTYSSRFIMGQIAETGKLKQGITYDPKEDPLFYKSVDALGALTKTPKPKLSYLEHYIFDKNTIAPENDDDGVVDAGETVDLAMVIRNHWGKADNVKVTIDTKSHAGIADPYVTILTDTVDYGAVGTFAIDDNGLIYENDMVTGVNLPFKLKIAPNTPNDHVVPINITLTGNNGYDSQDTTTYTFNSGFSFAVRNGVELPGVIDKDMTLTKDKYWIVPNATLIKEGATVNVEPGTQIQFWSSEPEDPYAEKTMAYIQVKGKFLVNGTAEEPVEMFPSSMYSGYEVKVYSTNYLEQYGSSDSYRGYSEIKYAKIMNPNLAVQKVDHSYFSQDLFNKIYKRYLYDGEVRTEDYYGSTINADIISNSRFVGMGSNPYNSSPPSTSSMFKINGISKGNLFDSSLYYMDEERAENNVYLKNYKLPETQYGDRTYWLSKGKGFGTSINSNYVLQSIFPVKYNENGSTYIAVNPNISFNNLDEINMVENYARELGGHIVTIDDAEENNIVQNYVSTYLTYSNVQNKYPNLDSYYFDSDPLIGLNDFEKENDFKWANGASISYSNWEVNEPNNQIGSYKPANFVKLNRWSGKWYDFSRSSDYRGYYIIEIPGVSNVTGIRLDKSSMTLGAGGGTEHLQTTITPAKATNKTVTWSSSDSRIASVDQNGNITPLSKGRVTISVKTEDGGYIATCEVNVIDIVPATGVSLSDTKLELSKGQQQTVSATVLPENSTNKKVSWSSGNESVATVNQNGTITAVDNGTTIITVTTDDGGYQANVIVSVIVPVEGISIDQQFLRMVVGDGPTALKATVQPETATNKKVIWSSSNTAVVTVDENGLVSPIGTGTAMVTAKTENGEYQAQTVVTVWETNVTFQSAQIKASRYHTLGLNRDGTVWAWGLNDYGQLGDGTRNNRLTPVQVIGLSSVKDIAVADNSSLVLKDDGTVWGWGYYFNSITPIKINISNVKEIVAGQNHFVALKADGTVWTWGYNSNGELGDGTNTYRSIPAQIPNLSDVISVSAGDNHSLALKKDGTVWAWGYNYYGQIGDKTYTTRLSPVKVQNLSGITAIDAGAKHNLALKNDGSVWAWGYDNHGQSGLNNYYYQNSNPQQIQSLSNIIKVKAGDNHSIVLKNDGTVWTFGNNAYGELGDSSINYQYTPYQVKDMIASNIEAGPFNSFIVKEDGTTWSWGYNSFGQLGNLSTTNSNKPGQVLFGILPDTTPPTLVSTSPVNGEIGVGIDTEITYTFTEGIKPGGNYPLITLRDQNYNTLSIKEMRIDGNILKIVPMNQLETNSNYSVYLPSNSLTDMFNNPTNQDFNLNFSTAANYTLSTFKERAVKQPSYFELTALLNKMDFNSTISTDSKLADGSTNTELTKSVATAETTTSNIRTSDQLVVKETSLTNEEITQQYIDDKKQAFINKGDMSNVKNNAILNRWWDPNVDHWMRFTSEVGENKRFLTENFWGTTNTDLIEKALIHFNDFQNMEEIIYKPILTNAPETAYPFVTDVYVSTESQERATKVGAENIQVHVLFNRDMDQTKQPQVSFGPDMPTTDYTVNGVDGGWTSPRHWVGSMKISPLTGDGYQFFRVAGAVAADDPWLVTGNDTERFRFEIVTSGTEAMNLQATGGEGKVNLSWTQDDFDTLAGYNVYRSENRIDGYTKINKSLIPSDQKSYEDTNVTPGKMYYYKFTVVKTDLTESNASNVASAAPIDTIAPVITHTPIQQAKVGQPVQIFADVTDNVKVSKVTLFYKAAKDTTYKQKEMVTTTNNRYSTTIDGTSVVSPWIDYYIEATDGATKAQSGNQNQPYRVMVSDKATITSVSPAEGLETGGTKVVITGSNFKQGASVLFGQAVASNVVVESENKITAETPAHYPAKVDVTVNNPDGTTGAILGGYTYISEGKEVSIANVTGNRGDIIDVPVYISNVSGLRSADFKVKFDAKLLKVEGVTLGNLTKNFSLASNKNTSGEVQLSMASSTAVNGSGSIAVVSFKVLDSELTSSALTLDQLSFNSGSIKTSQINGTFNLADTYSLTGNVRYYSNYRPVNNVLLELIGTNQQYQGNSDVSGYFALSGIRSGGYTLKPSKSDDINGISSYDASMILQYAVGLIQLDDYQKIAADVDGNGMINALDAAYVLEKSVDLIDLPFPGAGKVWTFTGGDRKYDNLSSDVSYQDFTAILLGDVNGDWGEASTNLSSLYKVGQTIVQGDGKLTAPVEFNVGEADIYSAKVSITYDPKEVKLSNVVKSETTKDYSLVYNMKEDGVVEIAIAGTTSIQGSGKLVDLEFEPIDTTINTTDLQLTNGNINDESIVVKSLRANKASNQSVGTKVKWTSDALGDGLTYSWVLYQGSIGVGKQKYSKNNVFETTLSKGGTYKVLLMVKDKNGKVVSKFSDDFIINE
ncbi:S8 family serine peptidase [Neobacillus drentensis]|uniref:S8 family serine peptidase n=1 Tax=Neobacillus drentensis TaxID=220684 RepID=UPI002FFDD9F8